ncbi:HipA domain-containing protein [Oscillatoria amoena NRMC-F 0135]|nr:HipA domain-containing protein [Oscillatoria amoena NRMC-F 0135]MDL5054666.1 HipA domain-containing protein [Oscillatoria laete-virens NRMC-F 0139]
METESRSDVEQLGSKPKFWFKRNGENWLFKEARKNTGEDWSEKLASEIASLLELPTHHAELAIWEEKRGCAVKSFINQNESVLVHGNELLGGLITGYDKEKERGQSDHTFDNIVKVIETLFPVGPLRFDAATSMVGYLVFDALVGNTDRHHQNWGVLVKRKAIPGQQEGFVVELAPTFDHASSLGRELTDEARERHLREATVERYILKGKSAIFANAQAKHGLSPIAVAGMLAERYPRFFSPWQNRVRELSETVIQELVYSIPNSHISMTGRSFVLAFLAASRKLIIEIK